MSAEALSLLAELAQTEDVQHMHLECSDNVVLELALLAGSHLPSASSILCTPPTSPMVILAQAHVKQRALA